MLLKGTELAIVLSENIAKGIYDTVIRSIGVFTHSRQTHKLFLHLAPWPSQLKNLLIIIFSIYSPHTVQLLPLVPTPMLLSFGLLFG